MPDLNPVIQEHVLVCLIDDCNAYETPACDYQPGQHGSVFLATHDVVTGLQFFQWKHGPLGTVDTMRVIYANTYQVERQLSIRMSEVCQFLGMSPSDVTYSDLEDYASMALISERLCNERQNWNLPPEERVIPNDFLDDLQEAV